MRHHVLLCLLYANKYIVTVSFSYFCLSITFTFVIHYCHYAGIYCLLFFLYLFLFVLCVVSSRFVYTSFSYGSIISFHILY